MATTMAPKAKDVSFKSGTDFRRPLADPPSHGPQGSYFIRSCRKRTDAASPSHPGSAGGLWAAETVRSQRSLCRSEQVFLERGSFRRGSPLGLCFCVWDLASTREGVGAHTGAGEGPLAGAGLLGAPGQAREGGPHQPHLLRPQPRTPQPVNKSHAYQRIFSLFS